MDNKQILEAMNHLDPQLIQEASKPVTQTRSRLRPIVLAACLILLIALPVMAITGNLLVEHYYGEAIPENLAEQELDAFFRVHAPAKIPLSSLSRQVSEDAAVRGSGVSYHSFETLDAAEDYLGLDIVDLNLPHTGRSVPITDAAGDPLYDTPCLLTLLCESGRLHSLHLQYFFENSDGALISLNANAVTDQNPKDNNASIGVSNDRADVVNQTSESYETLSGRQATIISTEYSHNHGWSLDGWMEKNGFVLRFSLSTDQEEAGRQTIRELLDAAA